MCAVSDGRQLGLGMIGSGAMAQVYAATVARYETGVRLAAVTGGHRAPALARDYSIPAEPSADRLLARPDVDAVLIATPHSTHRDLTVQAARAGRHILVEKPMALSPGECDSMIDAAARAGVTLSVIKTFRFRRSYLLARQVLDRGEIGRVMMLRLSGLTPGYDTPEKGWAHDPAEGGVFLDWGSHACDLVRAVGGADPAVIFASFANYRIPLPPAMSGMVHVELTNGVVAQLWMSFELPEPGIESNGRLLIVGETGLIDLDLYGELRVGDSRGWRTLDRYLGGSAAAQPLHPERLDGCAAQLRDFADSVRSGRPPSVSAEDGKWAVAMVEAAYRSWRTGEAVRWAPASPPDGPAPRPGGPASRLDGPVPRPDGPASPPDGPAPRPGGPAGGG
jgi:myo-inositol 2-dehydrogenase/D-chiro-inositol 1-dehydrogenase